MFEMTQHLYIYIGEKRQMGHICTLLANLYPKIFFFIINVYCHKKCFFY